MRIERSLGGLNGFRLWGTSKKNAKSKAPPSKTEGGAPGKVKGPTRKTDVWATQIRFRIYLPGHPPRYYDQSTGRFISEDPIAFSGGNNFFGYVRNTPTIFTDPSGLLNIDSSCNCSNGINGPSLQIAEQLAGAGASRITDPKLRDCILGKLNNGTVKCGGGKCDRGSKPDKNGRVLLGWALPFGDTIHLCKAASGNDFSLACTMIHELAHTCGHPRDSAPDRAANQAFPGLCN